MPPGYILKNRMLWYCQFPDIGKMSRTNKKKLLALLIVILGISLTWRILHPFRQERVERLTFTGKAPAQDTRNNFV